MERDGYMGDSGQPLSRSDLESRPSLDEVVAGYDELLAEIQNVVTSILPNAEVVERPGGEEGGCSAEVESVELADATARYFFPTRGIQARPTDDQWQQIRDRIAPLLEKHQFESTAMDAHIGDTRNLAVRDGFGAALSIGYNKAIALSLKSGCHLTGN